VDISSEEKKLIAKEREKLRLAENKRYWDSLSEERKEEILGHLYLNRHGEEEWQGNNSFYTDDCHIDYQEDEELED
tara:strand:+ start:777 stop:1004 length:228 start_codon:yes stop_codon:yes gene_type:complete